MKRDAHISKATTNIIVTTNVAGASNAVLALAAFAYWPISEATFLQINAPFKIWRTGKPYIVYDNETEKRVLI